MNKITRAGRGVGKTAYFKINANYSQLINLWGLIHPIRAFVRWLRQGGSGVDDPATIMPPFCNGRMNMDNLLAAVDLGSNSFRLSIGRVEQQDGMAHLYTVDNLRESVQLAAGLDDNNRLDEAAIARAIVALQRFGERLAGFSASHVRAVATNTFRVASNIAQVLPVAQQALGFPIAVISGREEARLIYLGVANGEFPSEAAENRRASGDVRLITG